MSVTVVDAIARIRPDFGNTLGSMSLIERGFALAIPLAIAGAGAVLVKMGMDAQTQLSIVAGLTGSTAKQMEYYTTSLESMGARFGMTLSESAKGLYYVVSAGYTGADAINVLTASMLHAAATGVPLKDVANGLTSAMNAYGASAKDATRYSDILTTAITYGKQTTADFANNVSKAALMAASAHEPFTQLAAAEAALTEKGEPANRAFTELSFMMSKIAVPSADMMAKSVSALGGHLDATKYQSADLMGKLLLLRNATGLTEDEFLKLIGGTRSARGALGLLADGGAAYNRILEQMGHNTGVTAAAFEIHTHTMQYAFDQVKASVSNAGYELVKLVSPVVIPFLQGIATAAGGLPNLFKSIGDWLRPLQDTITKVDGPMVTFGRHIGETSTILNTHKGYLSQVRDFLAPLGDTYTKVTTHTANFRGDITSTGTTLVRHKGILSDLQDFITHTVVPAVQGLGNAFVTNVLPALKEVWDALSKNLIPALQRLWDKLAPYLIPALQLLGVVLVVVVLPAIGLLIQFLAWTIDRISQTIGYIQTLTTWVFNLTSAVGGFVTGQLRYFRDGLGWARDRVGDLMGRIGDLMGKLGEAKDRFGSITDRIFDMKQNIGWLIDRIKDLIGWLGSIHVPDLGSIIGSHLPGHAAGGMASGLSLVGEQGPELAIFPTGTRIIPAAQTAALLGGSGGGGSSGGGGDIVVQAKRTCTSTGGKWRKASCGPAVSPRGNAYEPVEHYLR